MLDMKFSGTVDFGAKFQLNPGVLPFIPSQFFPKDPGYDAAQLYQGKPLTSVGDEFLDWNPLDINPVWGQSSPLPSHLTHQPDSEAQRSPASDDWGTAVTPGVQEQASSPENVCQTRAIDGNTSAIGEMRSLRDKWPPPSSASSGSWGSDSSSRYLGELTINTAWNYNSRPSRSGEHEQQVQQSGLQSQTSMDKLRLLRQPSVGVTPLDDIVSQILSDDLESASTVPIGSESAMMDQWDHSEQSDVSAKSQSCTSDVFSFDGSPGGSYLDNIWSCTSTADNAASPSCQSDRNSTSYGSLQRGGYLHEVFNDRSHINNTSFREPSPRTESSRARSVEGVGSVGDRFSSAYFTQHGGHDELASGGVSGWSGGDTMRSERSWTTPTSSLQDWIYNSRRRAANTAVVPNTTPSSNYDPSRLVGNFTDLSLQKNWSASTPGRDQWPESCERKSTNSWSSDVEYLHLRSKLSPAPDSGYRGSPPARPTLSGQSRGYTGTPVYHGTPPKSGKDHLKEAYDRASIEHVRQQYLSMMLAMQFGQSPTGPVAQRLPFLPHATTVFGCDPKLSSPAYVPGKVPVFVGPSGQISYSEMSSTPPQFAVPQLVPAFRAFRRTGPANELHMRLEETYEQFKQLENERKKTEAELARQNPGKQVSSDNSLSVPSLPQNPSRVDRLVVESGREHARVLTLLSRMEHLHNTSLPAAVHATVAHLKDTVVRVQLCRRDEIVNAINRHQHRDNTPMQKEKDVLALAGALYELGTSLRAVRTCMWCALQLTSTDLPQSCVCAAHSTAKRQLIVSAHGATRSSRCRATFDGTWEPTDDLMSDGEDIPEEDENDEEMRSY